MRDAPGPIKALGILGARGTTLGSDWGRGSPGVDRAALVRNHENRLSRQISQRCG